MVKSKWYLHPVFIFVLSLAAIGSSLTIYITSSLEISASFAEFMLQNNVDPERFLDNSSKFDIITLSTLCLLVIVSIAIIFTYYRKVNTLYRMQQNFINGFTHELKTPVTSLKLYLDTFSMYEFDRETLMKYIGFMKRDTNRLSDNISTILNLARIEDKKYVVDHSRIYACHYIKEIIEKNNHVFANARIEVYGDEKLYFEADRVLVEALFMNLLVNAITYNMNEKPKVFIQVAASDNKLHVSFNDDGIGLTKKDRKMIFKKFYRVKKAVKGSGIGLYLSSQIVKLHKGTLKADSMGPGHGSTFSILIPRMKNEK